MKHTTREDFKELEEKIESGMMLINLDATGAVLKVLLSFLGRMQDTLAYIQ